MSLKSDSPLSLDNTNLVNDAVNNLNLDNYSSNSAASRAESMCDNELLFSSIYENSNRIKSPICLNQDNVSFIIIIIIINFLNLNVFYIV